MTPIDRLIDASVSCTRCGTAGIGHCQCWDRHDPDPTSSLQRVAQDIAAAVLHHIDAMYPAMWTAVPKTARTSVRNTIINQVVVALTPSPARGRKEP